MRMIRLDTKVANFEVVNSDGTAMNLTGATVRFTAKWEHTDADADAVIKLDNAGFGGVTVNSPATEGTGVITIPKTATTSLPLHRVDLVYDLKVKTASGTEHTVSRGLLIVYPNVTSTV